LFLADSLTLDQAILDEGVGHPFRGNQYKEGESGGGKDKKVFSGQQVNTRTKLSKLETDKLGERVVLDYMRANGIKDARSANVKGNNYPVDIVGDHLAIELKSGLVSNGPSAQHWRATIGQPSKTEAAWLAKASAGAKAAHNEEKAQAIIDRKNAAVRELAKATGTKLAGMTVAVIINPDTKAMDLYAFKGFHARIGWKSDQAKAGFVKTIKYKGSR